MKKMLLFILFLLTLTAVQAQNGLIKGTITDGENPVPFANVYFKNTSFGTTSNIDGAYTLEAPAGAYVVTVQLQGYRSQTQNVQLKAGESRVLNFILTADALGLEEIVVSATRNQINKKEAPVIVNVLSPKLFKATQSITLAEGLNYQSGVRVETNCQNCGFTQVRLNGLGGEYTQVLVNSKPVFSALNGVYGLEQIPVSIIERVEVVRSGGSALFGSNAIAGTVNVITKEPINDSWEVSGNLAVIDGTSVDRNMNVNATIVSEDLSSGVTVYGMFRDRDAYDANDDGFTEITKLTNNSFGTKLFLRPNDNSKIGLDFTAIREFRRGGDRIELAPQFTDIAEELDHNTVFTGLDYEIYDDERKKTLNTYISVQHTDRDSYYGGLGGGRTRADSLVANNAFGKTKDLAVVGGAKYTHNLDNKDVITAGIEHQLNDTDDRILGYNRIIDQRVNSTGLYGQYEWKPIEKFTALVGARLDYVNVDGFYTLETIERSSQVEETVLSPRITLLYNVTEGLQFRGGYARGFRAPQAFNEDLHISSVGGEQRFVILSDDLESEFSDAFTGSLNFTKDYNKVQTNFLVEGFYTSIQNPFTIVSTGSSLPNGSILEESRNGVGAFVAGTNVELTVSPNKKWYFQAGATFQNALFRENQVLFEADGSDPSEQDVVVDQFVRTPDIYGFLNTNWTPIDAFKIDVTGSFTGPMVVLRVVSDSGFLDLVDSNSFFDLTTKLTYHFDVKDTFHIELSGGVQNLFNSFQDDFDRGALRDSDYVYGPSRPRTVFVGIKLGDF